MASGDAYRRLAAEKARDDAVTFVAPAEERSGPGPRSSSSPDAATFRWLGDRIRERPEAAVLPLEEPGDAPMTVCATAHGLVSLDLAGKPLLDELACRRLDRRKVQRPLRGVAGPRVSRSARRGIAA